MTFRTDSTLAQLTDDQQAQVFDWLQDLGYTETIKRLALPSPDGFGIKTYRASLHAFFVRYSAQLKIEHAASASELAAASTSRPAFASVSEDALHHRAFQLSTSPINLETFKELSRWVAKQKADQHKSEYVRIANEHLALARERLALERARFEFNAAREALNHHTQFSQIMANPHGDDEAKTLANASSVKKASPASTPRNNVINQNKKSASSAFSAVQSFWKNARRNSDSVALRHEEHAGAVLIRV